MPPEPTDPILRPATAGAPAGSIADLAGVAEQALRLSETMTAVHKRGWCEGTGGNFSCTISRNPLQLLMAPSGVDKGSVHPDDLIIVDVGGRVVRGLGKASAETPLHLAIVTNRQAGAVLHTHSQAATLLSRHHGPASGQEVSYLEIEQLEMLKGLEGIRSHDHRVRLPIVANDQDLDRLSRHAIPHLANAPYGLLLAGHGLYAWGSDLAQARRHLEILEFLLEQHWRDLLLNALLRAAGATATMGSDSGTGTSCQPQR